MVLSIVQYLKSDARFNMYCVNHPSVETLVTCSACGAPICPDCMVETPVAAKCPNCAKMPRSSLVRLKPDRLVLTVIIGLAAAAIGGFMFGLFVSALSFFAIIIAFGLGAGVGEAVSRASGRFRDLRLAAWASACAALGILFPFFLKGFAVYGLSSPTVDYVIAIGGVWKLLWMAAAAYGAWQRNA